MYCNNCGNKIEEGTRFCSSCGAAVETTAREVAPTANPQRGRIHSERFSEHDTAITPPSPSETRVGGNVEGRFSGKASKKGLFLVITGILVLAGLGGGGYWWTHRTPVTMTSGDIVIEKETQAPPEKPAEEKPAEAKTPAPAPGKPAQAQAPKTVKRAPAKTPTPKASTPSSNTPWRYRVESPTPAPKQPRAQANNRNPLGKLFDVFQGPAPDVTAPPAPNDARGTGM